MKFLIVDDDRACRELMHDILSPFAACHLAFDGHEAVAAFRLALDDGQPYDLVCLDIMMPGMDGHEALEAIRRLEQDRGISGLDAAKVVMTTALRESKHCIRAFEQGCESYYTKPIEEDRLLKQVEGLLGELRRMPAAAAPPKSAVGGLPAVAPAAPTPPAAEDGGGGARFLIVDDDGVCRALMYDILSPYGRCTFAYDGQEAVDSVRLALEDGKPYGLITLDIMMPGLNGHDALRGIRALEAQRGILGSDGVKIVMTTALRDSKHCVQSFREGCESYVTKPVDERELLGRMRELGLLREQTARLGSRRPVDVPLRSRDR